MQHGAARTVAPLPANIAVANQPTDDVAIICHYRTFGTPELINLHLPDAAEITFERVIITEKEKNRYSQREKRVKSSILPS